MASYSDTPKAVGENIKNILSEEQLLEMEKNGTVPPNEEFFTPEDDLDRDKAMILNWIYPIGSIYKVKNSYGVNPNTWGVGTWEKLAENVVMPLGSTVPVSSNGDINFTDAYGCRIYLRTPSSIIPKESSGNAMLYNSQTNTGTSTNSGLKYRGGLQVDLSQAANTISGVDIWLRTS